MPKLNTNPSGLQYPGVYRNGNGDGTQVGTYHLADNPQLYEIQRSNNFELIVTGLENLRRPGTVGDESTAVIKNAQEVIRLSVASSFVPSFSQQSIEIRRGNSSFKYAGVPTFSGGQVVVNDYIGADTLGCLNAWQALSYNVYTEKVGLASDYKKECTLIEYSPDYQVVRKFNLHGCWISSLTQSDFNSDGNDKHQITMTIEIDRAEIDTSEDI